MNAGIARIMNTLSTATTNAENARNSFKEAATLRRAESKGYNEGKAAAYNDAYYVMKAELERLRNRLQNGALTLDDFEV